MTNVRNITDNADRAVRSAGGVVRVAGLHLYTLPLLPLLPYPGSGPAGYALVKELGG